MLVASKMHIFYTYFYLSISRKSVIVRRSYGDFPKPWHRVYMEFYCIFWLLGVYWAENRLLTIAYPWATFFISNFSHLPFFAEFVGASKINFCRKGHMIYHFEENLMLIIFSSRTIVWKLIFRLFLTTEATCCDRCRISVKLKVFKHSHIIYR